MFIGENMPSPKDARLIFLMPLEDEPQEFLVTGLLRFEGETNHEFHCTSGQPGYQYSGGVLMRGKGPLPSSHAAEVNYTVSTSPIYSPDIPGIAGNFYPISPNTVNIGGIERGDFGIHNDANRADSPGSAGCIVFVYDYGFEVFEKVMACLRNQKVTEIPLTVKH